MIPKRFRVQMYKNIADSGWVDVNELTVIVGKNEAGKTSLLKALHKFKSFDNLPYTIDSEWPRGKRNERKQEQIVCSVVFALSTEEEAYLSKIAREPAKISSVTISRNYANKYVVELSENFFPDALPQEEISAALSHFPMIPEGVGEPFRSAVEKGRSELARLLENGLLTNLSVVLTQLADKLTGQRCRPEEKTQFGVESQYIQTLKAASVTLIAHVDARTSIRENALNYLESRIPTFVYMDEYRTFTGSAILDQVKARFDAGKPTAEDKTIDMILSLAGMGLADEVKKGQQADKEQRRYDLDDASKTLTNRIAEHWKQLRYDVELDADGMQFFTFVKGENDPSRIKLEERSRGFQWFFSFDLLLMYETKGKLKGCVILLDEPGLHLHPQAQRDLLERLKDYASDNTLIYSTHLPFMIDLSMPESIRVIEGNKNGVRVTTELTKTNPAAKLVLQAALGISGHTCYLLADKNLVVEGVDDYWIITELSNFVRRFGKAGLPEDLMVTAAGGASEVTYLATLMVGQELGVIALYDSDQAGNTAKDAFQNRWLAHYKGRKAQAISLKDAIDPAFAGCSIEHLFPDKFYIEHVGATYPNFLTDNDIEEVGASKGEPLIKRLEELFETRGKKFNKGAVAKRICARIRAVKNQPDLPQETLDKAQKLFKHLAEAYQKI